MIQKIRSLVGAMLVLVVLSGCLEMESVISLKKDGSGTLTETMKMGAQAAMMMQMRPVEGPDNPMARFDEGHLKENAKTMGEGVEFLGVEKTEEADGSLTYVISYKFADISNLVYNTSSFLETEAAPLAESEKMFSYQDGELTIAVPEPNQENFAIGNQEIPEEQLAMMAPMMAGMKGSVQIVCEGGIESTNACLLYTSDAADE